MLVVSQVSVKCGSSKMVEVVITMMEKMCGVLKSKSPYILEVANVFQGIVEVPKKKIRYLQNINYIFQKTIVSLSNFGLVCLVFYYLGFHSF